MVGADGETSVPFLRPNSEAHAPSSVYIPEALQFLEVLGGK